MNPDHSMPPSPHHHALGRTTCPICHEEFIVHHVSAKFCTNSCAQKAARQRRKERDEKVLAERKGKKEDGGTDANQAIINPSREKLNALEMVVANGTASTMFVFVGAVPTWQPKEKNVGWEQTTQDGQSWWTLWQLTPLEMARKERGQ